MQEPDTDQRPLLDKRQRLDKWLWYARVVKTRTLAQKLVTRGNVRIDGNRTTQASFSLSPGMVLTITYANRLLILRMVEPGTRRGPAPEAARLYEDLSPKIPRQIKPGQPSPVAARDPGAGRPTKKQRRQTDQLLARSNNTTRSDEAARNDKAAGTNNAG
jgi:ribosome-associated heat shock protein Hsp15